DALGQNLVAGVQNLLHLIREALVEHQDRVNVAVAGVEDVADTEAVLLRGGLNVPHDLRELRPRYDAVLGAVTRIAQAADRAERLLAGLPERHALGFGVCFANLASLVLLRDALDPIRFFLK